MRHLNPGRQLFCFDLRKLACVFGLFLSQMAIALEPADLYKKVERSIWTVRTFDAAERRLAQGSAVAIASGRLVTNCHVLAQAKSLVVRRDNVSYEAKLKHADPERDLCLLEVPNFTAPAVEIGSVKDVKVGARVYAIGNPRGLEATLSEGLISGLRGSDKDDGPDIIQTTAPVSPGSSGGGLFTSEGVLIGITTLSRKEAQNINFAFPADWIAEVPARAEAALKARKASTASAPTASGAIGGVVPPNAPASASLPAIGTAWKYRYTDLKFGSRQIDYVVQVVGLNGWRIHESVEVEAQGSGLGSRGVYVVKADETAMLERQIGGAVDLLEFSPYMMLLQTEEKFPKAFNIASTALDKWAATGEAVGWEQISIQGKAFRAIKVVLSGRRSLAPGVTSILTGPSSQPIALAFEMVAWFSPEVGRVVRIDRIEKSSGGTTIGQDRLELVELNGVGEPRLGQR